MTARAVPLYVCVRFVNATCAGVLVTLNVFVTLAAASQLLLPAWLATTLTTPLFVKLRAVPPVIRAGPVATT